MSPVIASIREVIARQRPDVRLNDDDELLQSGVLDSVGVLGLVTALEEIFGVQIDMEHLNEDNFTSIRTIAALVERLRAGEGRP